MTAFEGDSKNSQQNITSSCEANDWILSPYSFDHSMETMNLYEQQNGHQHHHHLSKSTSESSSKLAEDSINASSRNNILNAAVAELTADLTSPEISFDLQQFISSEISSIAAAAANQNTTPNVDDSSLFTELIECVKRPSNGTSHGSTHGSSHGSNGIQHAMPNSNFSSNSSHFQATPNRTSNNVQHVQHDSRFSVKKESEMYPNGYVGRNPYNAGLFSSRVASQVSPQTNSSKKSSKKHSDKGSEEYKKRRERNNVAVRKSREKAKLRSRDTEKKVTELLRDNDMLRKRLDLMASQMNVMKQLLTSVGVPSESIDNEIARNLQMEGLI